jgi:hypothetical protein
MLHFNGFYSIVHPFFSFCVLFSAFSPQASVASYSYILSTHSKHDNIMNFLKKIGEGLKH